MNPLISIIIPVFNGEIFIKRAIRSVIKQPNQSLIEIIIIDDGSSDKTGKICDDFAANYNNIIVIHNKNKGVGESRNDGLKIAKGKYCAFLDADDWLEDNFYSDDIVNRLKENEIDIFGFSYRVISFDFKFFTINNPIQEKFSEYGDREHARFDWRPFWSFIYRKEVINDNNLKLFPVKFNEDMSFTQRFFFLAKKVQFIDKYMYIQWSNNYSVMHNKKAYELFDQHCKSLRMLKEWFNGRGENFAEEYPRLAMISLVLPDMCAEFSRRVFSQIIKEDERFDIIKNYEKYPIAGVDMKNISAFKRHPKKYYFFNRLKRKIKARMKSFLYKHGKTRSIINYIYYKFIRRRKSLDKKEIVKIKMEAL